MAQTMWAMSTSPAGTVTAGNLTIGIDQCDYGPLRNREVCDRHRRQLGNITYWVNNSHNITAYGGTGTVNMDTTTNPGNIILTGGRQPPRLPLAIGMEAFRRSWSNPNNFQSEGSNLPGVPETGNTVWLASWAVRGAPHQQRRPCDPQRALRRQERDHRHRRSVEHDLLQAGPRHERHSHRERRIPLGGQPSRRGRLRRRGHHEYLGWVCHGRRAVSELGRQIPTRWRAQC